MEVQLIEAAMNGDKTQVDLLLKSGAKGDTMDKDGRMALDVASRDEVKGLLIKVMGGAGPCSKRLSVVMREWVKDVYRKWSYANLP